MTSLFKMALADSKDQSYFLHDLPNIFQEVEKIKMRMSQIVH